MEREERQSEILFPVTENMFVQIEIIILRSLCKRFLKIENCFADSESIFQPDKVILGFTSTQLKFKLESTRIVSKNISLLQIYLASEKSW